jgi:hypothetical protein
MTWPVVKQAGSCLLTGIFFSAFSKTLFMANRNNDRESGKNSNQEQASSKKGKADMQGAPHKSNRQTGGHEKDDSSKGADRNTTKKQGNSI